MRLLLWCLGFALVLLQLEGHGECGAKDGPDPVEASCLDNAPGRAASTPQDDEDPPQNLGRRGPPRLSFTQGLLLYLLSLFTLLGFSLLSLKQVRGGLNARGAEPTGPPGAPRGWTTLAGGIAFTILLWLLAARIFWVHLEFSSDGVRDFLMARDIVDLDRFMGIGPITAFLKIYQGGLWTLHLAVLRWFGLSPWWCSIVTLGLGSLAVVLMISFSRCVLGRWGALLTGIFGLGLLYFTRHTWMDQMNPSLLPLPAALFFGGALLAVRDRSPLMYVGASFSLGMMTALHPVSLIPLPALLVVLLLYPTKRPFLVLFAMLMAFCLPILAFSFGTLWDGIIVDLQGNLVALMSDETVRRVSIEEMTLWPMVAMAWVVIYTVGVIVSRTSSPSQVTLLLLTGLHTAAVSLKAFTGATEGACETYIIPAVPGLALIAADSARAGFSLLRKVLGKAGLAARSRPRLRALFSSPIALVGLVLVGHVLWTGFGPGPDLGSLEDLSMWELEEVAEDLVQAGAADWGTVDSMVRFPGLSQLISSLRLYIPRHAQDGSGAEESSREIIYIFRSFSPPPEALPEKAHVVPGDNKDWLYLVRRATAVQWEHFEIGWVDDKQKGGPIHWRGTTPRLLGHPEILHVAHLNEALETFEPLVHFRFGVVPRSSAPLLLIPLPDSSPNAHCPQGAFSISVSGLEVEAAGHLWVRLGPGQAGRRGTIEFVHCLDPSATTGIPFILEVEDSDVFLGRLIRENLSALQRNDWLRSSVGDITDLFQD